MSVNRFVRVVLAAAVGCIGIVSASTATPPAGAQQQCLPPGSTVAPVPWAQELLTPDRVWPMSTGAGQRVAVVGTGVAQHPQLDGRVIGSVDLAPFDQRSQASGAIDCIGVGTGVAGIIAARSSESVGFHGMAPGAEVLSAKVVGDRFLTGSGQSVPPNELGSAIDWAVQNRATVIAIATVTYEDTEALRQSVRQAQKENAVIVAATGETGTNEPPGRIPYPAAYDGVIGVGGIAQNGLVTPASRLGHIDLVAPGYDVLTTCPGSGLGPASGSAFATGYVAAAVALARAYQPDLTVAETVKRMFATAAPAPEGTGSDAYGYGLVNPYQAVVENVVAGSPVELPAMTPSVMGEAERARLAAESRSDTLAFGLAAGGAVLVVTLVAVLVFGPRGRERRWRSGLADLPEDRPEDESPEPPAELFGDRPKRTS